MKLLFCKNCCDIINLTGETKACGCGQTQGVYLDQQNAIYVGPAVPFGIDNGEFAVHALHAKAGRINAFMIPKGSRYFKRVDE